MNIERVTKAIVDRFEGTLAVLVNDNGGEVVCSRSLLPNDISEGDALKFSAITEGAKTQAMVQDVQRLIDEM